MAGVARCHSDVLAGTGIRGSAGMCPGCSHVPGISRTRRFRETAFHPNCVAAVRQNFVRKAKCSGEVGVSNRRRKTYRRMVETSCPSISRVGADRDRSGVPAIPLTEGMRC